MKNPKEANEVQLQTNKIVALLGFMARSKTSSTPIFQLLRKSNIFQWTKEHEKSFKDLKE